jgi:uncharacterized protein (TIGR02145 family)
VINRQELEEKMGIKRNTLFNLEEIKVRWKKAALENCIGVPCIIIPPPPPPPSFTCGTSTISDIDNNAYSTVLIGTQRWTKENLRVRKYNDGSEIKFDTSGGILGNEPYQTWNGLIYGAYTLNAHDSTSTPSNLAKYGNLYNQYAAMGLASYSVSSTKNICPTGWHVPSVGEWRTLSIFINQTSNTTTSSGTVSNSAGGKLKSRSNLWPTPGTGTDDYGFSALPGGERLLGNTGIIGAAGFQIGRSALFWTSTINIIYELDTTSDADVDLVLEESGYSIRCLKD